MRFSLSSSSSLKAQTTNERQRKKTSRRSKSSFVSSSSWKRAARFEDFYYYLTRKKAHYTSNPSETHLLSDWTHESASKASQGRRPITLERTLERDTNHSHQRAAAASLSSRRRASSNMSSSFCSSSFTPQLRGASSSYGGMSSSKRRHFASRAWPPNKKGVVVRFARGTTISLRNSTTTDGRRRRRRRTSTFCAVLEPERQQKSSSEKEEEEEEENASKTSSSTPKVKRLTKSEREKNSKEYEWAAWVSSCGITSIAITATYFRLLRDYNLMDESAFPTAELFAQLALIAGAAVGMEFYARFAHKYLWHDVWWSMPMKYRKDWNRRIWLLHESHHLPREGAFEANDIFAVANGVPAFALCAYGFFTPGVFGGLCFGAGLGITLFGIAYMYVHDGMVHKRFPTGPLGKLPWLRRVAAGHAIHHTEKFEGVPWGLFLGENELRRYPGGIEELDKVCLANDRADKRREMECLAAGFSSEDECDATTKLSAVSSQDDSELGIKAGLHIPSQVEPPQCVITEDGKRPSTD